MIATSVLVATLTLGVDTGWQPAPEGGVEYIIQIDPLLLRSLSADEPITSEVPEVLGPVRRFRVQLGTGPLPHVAPEPPPTKPAPPLATDDTHAFDLPQDDETGNMRRIPKKAEKLGTTAQQPRAFEPGQRAAPLAESSPAVKQASAEKSDEAPAAAASPRTAAGNRSNSQSAGTSAAAPSGRPWGPFLFSLLLLTASLAANVYLVWIWLDTRRRYQTLARQHGPAV